MDGVLETAPLGLRRGVDHVAVNVVLPPVVDAPEAAPVAPVLVPAEEERGAPVRALIRQQADTPFDVPECHQGLSQEADASGRPARLRYLLREERGKPVPPEHVPHRRSGAHTAQELVLFLREQGHDIFLSRGLGGPVSPTPP